jgi:protein-tyrosine phosphatase
VKTILFVCTANICRSPMAAALMRQRLASLGLAGELQVLSAGVYAPEGRPASELAIATLAGRGIALEEHRSQPVSLALLQQADVALVMEEAHRRSLFYLAPELLSKVFLMSELVGRHENVTDPFGGTAEDYERTVAKLEALIVAGLPNLLKWIARSPAPSSRGAE